ncbi:MAG TPA: mechanosensitive ion channel family protein [Gaiellaceae bacterium]
MLDPLINLLTSNTPLSSPLGRVVVIVALFATAWFVARLSAFVARRVLAWHDRRHSDSDLEATGKIADLKRRETLVSVIRTGIAYAAFAAAVVLSVAQLTGGVDRLTALAGASFALIVAGFAVQRLLIDILAGLAMFLERWYSVGDTVVIVAGIELQGVVEDVSLRRTKLRALNGEVIQVHNSQITAARVLPRGVKELAIELFVSKREEGERLVGDIAAILPEGPTTFVRRPWVSQVDELSPVLARIRIQATVAPGREWLAENFFSDLLKQRAANGLIVHGPVVLAVDERATRSFARASATTRRAFDRAAGVAANG